MIFLDGQFQNFTSPIPKRCHQPMSYNVSPSLVMLRRNKLGCLSPESDIWGWGMWSLPMEWGLFRTSLQSKNWILAENFRQRQTFQLITAFGTGGKDFRAPAIGYATPSPVSPLLGNGKFFVARKHFRWLQAGWPDWAIFGQFGYFWKFTVI